MQEEAIFKVSPSLLCNEFLEKVWQAARVPEINVNRLLELYAYCLNFARMNDLSEKDCERLTTTFSDCIAPILLKGGYGQAFSETCQQLKTVLKAQGEGSVSSREKLNDLQLEKAQDLMKAANVLPPENAASLPSPEEFNRLETSLLAALSEANDLVKSEVGLAQLFTALERLIHLSLQGYQPIPYIEQCKLLAEAMQYSCLGLSLAQKRHCPDKVKRFEYFIDMIFAHYVACHVLFKKGEARPYLLDVLYFREGKLEVLSRLFQTADLLLLHAVLLAEDQSQQSGVWLPILEKAKGLYQEIVKWGIKEKSFAAIGTQALSRMSALAECQDNCKSIEPLKPIMCSQPGLISWQENRKALKALREETERSLKATAMGDTLSIVEKYNHQLKAFTSGLLKGCLSLMGGDLPFKYVLLGLGSLAREEACPRSDIEYALIEEGEQNKQNEKIVDILLGLFEISVYSIGETASFPKLEASKINLPAILPMGYEFDRNYIPFNNLAAIRRAAMRGPAEALLSSLSDVNLGNMLQGACLLFAGAESEDLYDDFRLKLQKKLDQGSGEALAERIRKNNVESTKPFAKTDSEINIKYALLQLPVFLLVRLSLEHGLRELSSRSKLEELEARSLIDPLTAEVIRFLLSVGLRLRYLAHFHHGEENDTLCLQPPSVFLEVNLLKILESLRAGAIPVLHPIFEFPETLSTLQPKDYQAAMPAFFLLAEDYFNRGQLEKAFKYYELVMMLSLSDLGIDPEYKALGDQARAKRAALKPNVDKKAYSEWGKAYHFYQKPRITQAAFPVDDVPADFNPNSSWQSESGAKKPGIPETPAKKEKAQEAIADLATTPYDPNQEPSSGEHCSMM